MKRMILLLAMTVFICHTGRAQVADPAQSTVPASLRPGIPADATVFPAMKMQEALTPTNIFITYLDTKTTPYIFRVPTNYNNNEFQSVNVGQRFTLPTADGFLDSLYIIIRELPVGKIRFDVLRDAMRARVQTDTTKYHYPDYWTMPPVRLDTARLAATENDTAGYTKIVFNHKIVPQEFHIVVAPQPEGGISPLFATLSDSKKGDESTLNPKVARSTMLILYQSNFIPVHMHGFFTDNIGQAMAPDWYMVAFLEVDLATGRQTVAIPVGPGLDQNYPNPFSAGSGFTVIPFTMTERGFVTLEVCDPVGRVVRTLANEEVSPGSHVRVFDAKGLPSGQYSYRLISGNRQLTRSMFFVK